MYWHIISFAFLLTVQFLTSVSGDHKRIVVYVPHRITHHKRMVTKNVGGGGGYGDYNVIGFSGGVNLDTKSASEDFHGQRYPESYGGGHGQVWFKASDMQSGASVFGGDSSESGFGPSYKEVDSFEGGFGGYDTKLADSYFPGRGGFDASYRRR